MQRISAVTLVAYGPALGVGSLPRWYRNTLITNLFHYHCSDRQASTTGSSARLAAIPSGQPMTLIRLGLICWGQIPAIGGDERWQSSTPFVVPGPILGCQLPDSGLRPVFTVQRLSFGVDPFAGSITADRESELH